MGRVVMALDGRIVPSETLEATLLVSFDPLGLGSWRATATTRAIAD
jgi:hypothetical protein